MRGPSSRSPCRCRRSSPASACSPRRGRRAVRGGLLGVSARRRRRREAWARVLGLGFLEYVVLSVAALVASAALFFHLDGHASLGVTLPALTIAPAFAVAAWATSPKRVERLSRPRHGLRRVLADAVAGASYVRPARKPARARPGVVGNVLYWAGDLSCLWSAAALCGVEMSLEARPRLLGRLRPDAARAAGRRGRPARWR